MLFICIDFPHLHKNFQKNTRLLPETALVPSLGVFHWQSMRASALGQHLRTEARDGEAGSLRSLTRGFNTVVWESSLLERLPFCVRLLTHDAERAGEHLGQLLIWVFGFGCGNCPFRLHRPVSCGPKSPNERFRGGIATVSAPAWLVRQIPDTLIPCDDKCGWAIIRFEKPKSSASHCKFLFSPR